MKFNYYLLGLLSLSILSFTSCGDKGLKNVWASDVEFADGGKLRVAATTTMVQDLVRTIGADEVDVYGVMGDGIDPHSFEERPSDTIAMKGADVIFYSGHHLEGKLHDKLEKMEHAHAVTGSIDKASLIIPEEEYGSYADPHLWGDPVLWSNTVEVVVNVLSKKDPANKNKYVTRGVEMRNAMLEINSWAKKRLQEIPAGQRILVTSHDAFAYYAKAFDFEVRAIDGLAPGDKGGSKKVKDLVAFIKAKDIKMIFPESAANSKGIASIAQDAGVAVSSHELFADATGKRGVMETINGETYDVGTYIGMIKHNVNAIVEGLK